MLFLASDSLFTPLYSPLVHLRVTVSLYLVGCALYPSFVFRLGGLDPTSFRLLFSTLLDLYSSRTHSTMSPVLASSDPLEVYLGFANPIYSALNDSLSSSNILFPTSSHSDSSSLVKRLAHDAAITVAKQSARHKAATLSFVKAYQWIIVGFVGILAIRNIILIASRNNRRWQLCLKKLDELHRDKMGEKGMRPLGHRAPMSAKLDAVIFYPFTSKWWLGLENPLQLFLLVATIAINTGFILVSFLSSRSIL